MWGRRSAEKPEISEKPLVESRESSGPRKAWWKRVTVVGIASLLIAGLADYPKAKDAFVGLISLVEDSKVFQFRFVWLGEHRIKSALEIAEGTSICVDKITPFPPLGPNRDSALVEWRFQSTDDKACNGLRNFGVVDGRSWVPRYLANDYRDEDANQFVELHDPWIITKGENSHRWGVGAKFLKDGELKTVTVPGRAYPYMDMPIHDGPPPGGIELWTLDGLVRGDGNSGTLMLVDPKEYAWSNTAHFIVFDYKRKIPTVRDKGILVQPVAGKGKQTKPTVFNLYYEPGDRFYLLGNCGMNAMKQSPNWPGAWVVDLDLKDAGDPGFSCYNDEVDDHETVEEDVEIDLKR